MNYLNSQFRNPKAQEVVKNEINHHCLRYILESSLYLFFAGSAKTNIEVSFKKIHSLTLRIYFKKYTIWREWKVLFFSQFIIITSYIFPENFIEIHQVSQKIWNFTSIFVNFVDFFTFTCYKKLITSASVR